MRRRSKASTDRSILAEGGGLRVRLLLATGAALALACSLGLALASAAQPTVSIEDASAVSYASAHAEGTVDPQGQPTTYRFQYATQADFSDAVTAKEETIEGAAQTVEADLSGLHGATTYFLRLLAENGEGQAEAVATDTFTTLPVEAPKALSIEDATDVTYTAARFSGEVERPANADPAFDIDCRFEYVSDQQFSENEANALPPFEGATAVPCDGNPITVEGKSKVSAEATELAVQFFTPPAGVTYHLRLNTSNAGGSDSVVAADTFKTLPVPLPVVSIEPPVALSSGLTRLSGEINPGGSGQIFETEWLFECVPGCPEAGEKGAILPAIPGDGADHPVSKDLKLEPNAQYEITLSASNAGGYLGSNGGNPVTVGPITYATPVVPPDARTLDPGLVQVGEVQLAAQVNPHNSATTYQFEWGAEEGTGDETYENVIPASPQAISPTDNSAHFLTESLSGLSPSTTYHYRIRATNTDTEASSVGLDRTFTTRAAAPPSQACPNQSSRVGPSADLPDCRVYELATPGLNNAASTGGGGTPKVLPDGSAIAFVTQDSIDDTEGSFVFGWNVARRGPDGWHARSLNPPGPEPEPSYLGASAALPSEDFTEAVVYSSRSLAGPSSPAEANLYIHRADGSYVRLTPIGGPFDVPTNQFQLGAITATVASDDFSHVFMSLTVRELPDDPPVSENLYEWSDGELRLVTILPGSPQAPAPNGGNFPFPAGVLKPYSATTGEYVLFYEGRDVRTSNALYLRERGAHTVDISVSQRTVDPDPNPPAAAESVGMAADGSEALFTSASELTDDANTGESGGVANDSGADLYSYDVSEGVLTDLTVDDKPADSERGADVTRVVGANPEGTYLYFVATGNLAPGGVSGEQNLYVEYEGEIDYVSPGAGITDVYVVPDGTHAAIVSSQQLTGYDNAGQDEVYHYSYRGAVECASCRTGSGAPIAGAQIRGRAVSDNGERVFFESSDEVVPGTAGGASNVYEYEDGQVYLLTPLHSVGDAVLSGASASGGDVFLTSHAELTSGGAPGSFAIYDARVDAEVPRPPAPPCSGEECSGPPSSPGAVPSAGSREARPPQSVVGPSAKSVKGRKLLLRVTVPQPGRLAVTGRGLKKVEKKVPTGGLQAVTVVLRPKADKTRLRKGVFRTKAMVSFTPTAEATSNTVVSLKFDGPHKKRGAK